MTRGRTTPRAVHLLTATLAVCAVALAAMAGATRSGPAWVVVPLLAALVVAGMLEVHFEYRGHLEALDLFEAALMPVILLTPGVGAVALAAVAKAVSQRLLHVPLVKATFNVAQWAAATATASAVFVAFDGPAREAGAKMSLLAVGMLAGIVVNHLSVTTVLAVVQQRPVARVLAGLESVVVMGWVFGGGINIAFGLLFASVAGNTPTLVPLFLVPLAVLHWAERGYAESRADRARMQSLQSATHELTAPVDPDVAIGAFLAAVQSSFESAAVDVVIFDGTALQVHHCGEVDTTQLSRQIVAGLGSATRVDRVAAGDGTVIGDLLAPAGRRDCLYTALRHGSTVKGWLLSYDRSGFSGFEKGEATIFEALAAELAGALQRFELLAALVRERAHLFDIVHHSSDAIFTIDPEGRVNTWNPAMVALTGYEASELGGLGLAQVRPRDANGDEILFERYVATGRGGLPGDIEILTRGGERRWLACSYATASAPHSLVVVARDVTRQREVEQLKDDFVATISHELQTPLTTIIGFTNLLLDTPSAADAKTQAEALAMIRKGTRRLARLISNLLEISRVEAQATTTRPAPVDVNQVCSDVVGELRDSWPGREIVFTPSSGVVVAVGNQLSVEQILSNLVGNALKYAPESVVHIDVEEQPTSITIRVSDDGPGIPSEHLERIFERFERLDHNHVQAGTGLGLYISRQLARAMSGRLTVRSDHGIGTTFALELPAEVHLVAVS